MNYPLRTLTLTAVLLLWLGAVGSGFAMWERYETTAGPTLQPLTAASTAAGESRPELAVYVHPHCPCARATLAEVAALADTGELSIRIVFVRPAGVGESWESGRLWEQAMAIPGATVRADESGTEARRVRATTSGFAVFRDAAGAVRFRGGLTAARGRTGASAGSAAIRELLAGNEPAIREAPTFGCPLFDE